MKEVTEKDLSYLYKAPRDSHKGQNGKVLIIGGSELFHAASMWALLVASRIVDLVHYSSVPENNEIVLRAKEEFRNGIVVKRGDIDEYIQEDDCILIGPGMTRDEKTREITNSLLEKYPNKQWVIDAGALQMIDVTKIPKNAILTPHEKEFQELLIKGALDLPQDAEKADKVKYFAKKYTCVVLLKGVEDIACSGGTCDERVCVPGECRIIKGGNAGMTKGGTGDVLAGLISALSCKNDPFLATIAGSYINKKAGDSVFARVGTMYNATDLANAIPLVMKPFTS